MDTTKIGAVGGRGGLIWEQERDELAGIFVSYCEDKVYSLQFLNCVNGNFVSSEKYGSPHCKFYSAVILNYPSEFLTSISGSFERVNKKSFFSALSPTRDLTVLRAIKFSTNKGSYGPFGTPSSDGNNNIDFNFVIGNQQFLGGFHGTKNCDGIESIGFYMKNIPSSLIKKDLPVQDEKKKD
ncbi:inactive protein RESTRICTED TEV MOVEMENT 1-like [Solanum tuberosum]|uniref:Restricted tev movement 1 n=1 Tax=Solanum tuberosum TaxID=4113 RepID=M1DDG5_SOLTU|nr:PREDICTED: inactive protein RESTRICTED TEV MOVEMENT 1-like [Solanum tuberosum]